MSGHDLYLVLRERVESVAEGFYIGKDVLDAAQATRGYSHERMGRELRISEKTWRRWKEKGVIPYEHLDEVASVLRLEIERPTQKVLRDSDEVSQEERLARLEEMVARAIVLLEAILAQQVPSAAPTGAASRQRG